MPAQPRNPEPRRVRQMVRAALAAYHDQAEGIASALDATAPTAQIEPFGSGDTEGFLSTGDGEVVVAFRGSQTLGDWIYNASIQLVDWPGGGRVHQGFAAALDAAWPALSQRIRDLAPEKKLWFTGHSLGGALALLAADRLRRESSLTADGIFTFGMPKLGDDALMHQLEAHFSESTFHFLNEGDPVPWLPALHDEFAAPSHGIYLDGTRRPRPRPGALEAALLFVAGLIGEQPENLLEFKPHSKEHYVRLVEKAFAP